MNRLLARQLRRLGLHQAELPDPATWEAFIRQVGEAYDQNDQDRRLIERSLELTSDELMDRNARLEGELRDREQARAGLMEALSLREAIMEATDDGILVVDLERRVTARNARALDMMGLPPDTDLNGDARAILHGAAKAVDDADIFQARVEAIYEDPEASSYDIIGFTSGRIVERRSHPQRLGGVTVGRVWIFHDVTEQRRAAEDLRRAQAHLASVVSSAPLVLFAFDKRGVITLSEGRALASLGLRPGELVGRSVFEAFQHNPTALDGVRRALAGEDFTHHVEEGGLALETAYTPIRSEHGEVIGAVGVANDVTLRFRLEKEAAEQREHLHRAARLSALGTLVAGVAHEINNPLMYIQGHIETAQMALDRTPDGEPIEAARRSRAVEGLEQALQGTDRIAQITRSLKVVARGPSGARSPIDLRAIVADVRALVEAALPTRVRLEVSAPATAVEVVGNRDELHQVVLNLVQNAVEAVSEGGHVRVAVSEAGDETAVVVDDDGPGIPPEVQAQLFTPFFTTKVEGTGLGLSIAHAIVREHAGDIAFTSRPGAGTHFTIRLPKAAVQDPLRAASSA